MARIGSVEEFAETAAHNLFTLVQLSEREGRVGQNAGLADVSWEKDGLLWQSAKEIRPGV